MFKHQTKELRFKSRWVLTFITLNEVILRVKRLENVSVLLLDLRILILLSLKLHGQAYFIGKSVVLKLLQGPEFRSHH